jgi:hypothetical protein
MITRDTVHDTNCRRSGLLVRLVRVLVGAKSQVEGYDGLGQYSFVRGFQGRARALDPGDELGPHLFAAALR